MSNMCMCQVRDWRKNEWDYDANENCGDRPRESLIFQGFPDVGLAATPCLDILCRPSARW